MAQANHIHYLQNGDQVLGAVDGLQALNQMLRQRIDTLNIRLCQLKQQPTQATVSLEDRIHNIIHVVDEQLRRTTRNQVQVAADLPEQLALYVVML